MLNRALNFLIVLFVILVVGIETHTYWLNQLRPWQPASPIGRIIFYYSFFTVLSNIMLALSCLILTFKPNCSNLLFNVIRLNGLVGVLITMIVYNLMLRGIHRPPTVLLQFANESLHVVIPLLGLISWLIYGPFYRMQFKVIVYAFLTLLTYGVYIFMRGYYTNLYPYPFINVNRVGYENAFIAVIAIAVLFVCLVLLLKAVEFIRLKLKYQIIHH
ncbi:Pr6Pr family membrane protein [Orbus sasakiae]|uniref:Pr6Pr family membrane protein n=1 Tax=Orbus sasakiae TaxID=1078475 RepID=A0ABP9N3G4_9GAMM